MRIRTPVTSIDCDIDVWPNKETVDGVARSLQNHPVANRFPLMQRTDKCRVAVLQPPDRAWNAHTSSSGTA